MLDLYPAAPCPLADLLYGFLSMFVFRFESNITHVDDPLAPSRQMEDGSVVIGDNIMHSCYQIGRVCQSFRKAMAVLSPENNAWDKSDTPLLPLLFGVAGCAASTQTDPDEARSPRAADVSGTITRELLANGIAATADVAGTGEAVAATAAAAVASVTAGAARAGSGAAVAATAAAAVASVAAVASDSKRAVPSSPKREQPLHGRGSGAASPASPANASTISQLPLPLSEPPVAARPTETVTGGGDGSS